MAENNNNNHNENSVPKDTFGYSEEEKRKIIRQIFSSKDLNPQQKNARVQAIMSGQTLEEIEANEMIKSQKVEELLKVPLDTKITYFSLEQNILGCQHYQRGCKIRAKCCGQLYTCRICHDNEAGHTINRFETSEIFCMHCQKMQPPSADCAFCGKTMGHYYCSVCKFFDNDKEKKINHCSECGICRLGDNNYHCKICNMCYDANYKDNHDCRPNKFDVNCPICHLDCFSSRDPSNVLNCGHVVHTHCKKNYAKTNYKCPLCSKSMFDMSAYWQLYEREIRSQPMPSEWEKATVYILCSDCEKKNKVPYHFIGNKCSDCGGYNTRILQSYDFPPSEPTTPAQAVFFLAQDLYSKASENLKENNFAESIKCGIAALERLKATTTSQGHEAIEIMTFSLEAKVLLTIAQAALDNNDPEKCIQMCMETKKTKEKLSQVASAEFISIFHAPFESKIFVVHARACLVLGRQVEAVELLKKALELNKDNQVAKKMLNDLEGKNE